MAPGSLVLAATSTLNKTVNVTYEISSGTSLSCPHVASVAALLKTAHPEWSATAINRTTDILNRLRLWPWEQVT
jgi:subtilisin family serine protease